MHEDPFETSARVADATRVNRQSRMQLAMGLWVSLTAGCGDTSHRPLSTEKRAEPAWQPLRLERLGLQVDIPQRGVVNVVDLTVDAPSVSLMLVDCETAIASIAALPAQTLELAKQAITGEYADWHPVFTRVDKTSDGWALEFETRQGSQANPETMLHLVVRRTFDGKPYQCSLNTRDPTERACAAKVCASLRKL